MVLWIMLNPSTADDGANDPTIRRVCGFSRAWGFRKVEIRNLFAYRATDPADMANALRRMVDVIGVDNNQAISSAAASAMTIIAAWGAHELAGPRGRHVAKMLYPKQLRCLGTTKAGAPRHPLYVPASFVPLEYRL
jgi:hypothetical protein